VTAAIKDPNTSTVTGAITPSTTTGVTVLWFSKGDKKPATFPSATAASTATVSGLTEDQPAEDATSSTTTTALPAALREAGTNETALNREGLTPIDAPRQTDGDYEVCARFIRNNALADTKCATVVKKDAAATTPGPRRNGNGMGGNPFMQQPMGPTRGGPSDAVFRGIR
jgi:hypothetical protein